MNISQNKKDEDVKIKNLQGRNFKIIVACGTGIATASAAAESLRSRFESMGIKADFAKCGIQDAIIMIKNGSYDLLVSTAGIPSEVKIPSVSGVPFLTGIGVEEVINQIVEILNKKIKEET
ncbi:PTS sugar transporter subunit IIB [Caldisericum sp.]|uniref:PTS sugar transporter subunit IIB n=1 Tax=Caldisericum sp. TaxID=2499687 RepID=UPI003D09E01F